MAGYRLDLTTSGHGSVSRGLCEVDSTGSLTSVTEHSRIVRRGASCISLLENGDEVELPPDALVSMNLWGFTPAIFDMARPLFAAFIEEQAASARAEFFLPSIVNEMIAAKGGSVRVFPSSERWMGMSYREDGEALRSRLSELGRRCA